MKPLFFATAEEFGAWLEEHHETETELIVGFYKKGSGKPSITWAEAVEQALRFGWIDSVRRSLDEASYTNRFTPRKPRSNWSLINVAKVEELKQRGLMAPAGLRAYEARTPERTGVYSSEREQAGGAAARVRAAPPAQPAAWRGSRRARPATAARDPLGDQREARGDPAAPPPAADRLLGGGAQRAAAGAMNGPDLRWCGDSPVGRDARDRRRAAGPERGARLRALVRQPAAWCAERELRVRGGAGDGAARRGAAVADQPDLLHLPPRRLPVLAAADLPRAAHGPHHEDQGAFGAQPGAAAADHPDRVEPGRHLHRPRPAGHLHLLHGALRRQGLPAARQTRPPRRRSTPRCSTCATSGCACASTRRTAWR